MKELKHVKNYQEGATTAVMLIYADIGEGMDEVNGRFFAEELKWLNENGVTSVDIHINSGGGSVIDALSIMAAIRNFDGNVCTINDGIAASSAGWIFASGNTRKMVDFGRLMIHNPMMQGDLNEKQENALAQIKSMLVQIFENQSGLDSDQVDKMMNDETWLNATEALEMKLVDEIISTNRESRELVENVFSLGVSLPTIMNLTQNIKTKISNSNSNPKIDKMKNVKNHLSLDEAANESSVLESIKGIESDRDEYKNKVEALEADLESEKVAKKEVENKLNALNEKTISTVVDNAIDNGLFDKEKREEMIETATKIGVEAFNTLLANLKKTPVSITNELESEKGDPKGDKKFENKSFREIEKSGFEGEKYLNKLKKESPKEWQKLFDEQYS